MKITVFGAGYVGLSISTLLSTKYEVNIVDVVKEKVEQINNRISPIKDEYIEKYFKNKTLNLIATTNASEAIINADIIVIAVPTNYDSISNYFDTSCVEIVLKQISELNKHALVVIKSTIPEGYTLRAKNIYQLDNLVFSPEFLRESKALYDNLYPSRIIVGSSLETKDLAMNFANMLKSCSLKPDVEILHMSSSEAEAVKLFANTYLALRVSFFNELDNYAIAKNLNPRNIIKGICLDPRIGDYYNNPSFGYGGYCLPKDTKQLLSNFGTIPQSTIAAVIESNQIRKNFIALQILNALSENKTVGVYRLTMKSNSDNFREAAIIDVIKILNQKGCNILIYEPSISVNKFENFEVTSNFDDFANRSSLILTNRIDEKVAKYITKIYTRDIFFRD